MFANLYISSFNEFVTKKFYLVLIIESDNSLVNGIVTSTIPIWAWWSDILDTHA